MPAKNPREYRNAWNAANRDKTRSHWLRTKYGITLEDFNRMVENQGGVCKICKGPFQPRAEVDHSHHTGTVRGILCSSCNSRVRDVERGAAGRRHQVDYNTTPYREYLAEIDPFAEA